MTSDEDRGLTWQIGVWDDMAEVYVREIDQRFGPIIDHILTRAALQSGHHILDLGTGTGAVALSCAPRVAPDGRVIGVDISPERCSRWPASAHRERGSATSSSSTGGPRQSPWTMRARTRFWPPSA